MTIGYDQPLYVLPFDHRASFSKELFGWQGPLSPEQTAAIAAVKRVIFDAVRVAVADGVPKEHAGILVDEQFGAAILHDAREEGLITACPAEKSGQDEFDFEYGPDFAPHIEKFDPTFCKVLVRYNAEGDTALNEARPHACGSCRTTCTRAADCTCSSCSCPRRKPSWNALGATRRPMTSNWPHTDGSGDSRASGFRRRTRHLEDRRHRAQGGLREDGDSGGAGGRDKVGLHHPGPR